MTSKQMTFKFTIMLITSIIAMLMITSLAWGADATVLGIEFEQDDNVTLYVEQDTLQLKVMAQVSGTTTKKDVTNDAFWLSSQPSMVKVEKGLLTPLKKGSSIITAKYLGYSITLTATADYLFKSIVLDHTELVVVELGDGPELELTAIDHDDEEYIVTNLATWTTSNSQVATVDKGKLTLVSTGTITISAKYKGLTTSVQVKITSPYSRMDIVPGTDIEMLVGQEATELDAIATLVAGGLTENVTEHGTWSSSNASIVTVTNGELTAIAQGTATITVSYLGVTATIPVIARLPYQALKVTPDEDLELFVTDVPIQLKAEVMNDIHSSLDVTSLGKWTTSNPLAAVVVNGKVTPKSTGVSVIGFTYRGMSHQIQIAVYPTISALEVTDHTFELFKEEVVTVPIVDGIMLNGQHLDVSPLLEWSSSDETIATVKNNKIEAKKPGTVTLTAKVRQLSVTIQVTVQEKVLTLLSEVSIVSMIVGSEIALPQVTAVFEDGVEMNVSSKVEWKASSSNLLIKATKMKALVAGKVTLTGTYLNKKIIVNVIQEPEIVQFIIEPLTIELNPGRSKMISVKGVYKDGKTVSLGTKIIWQSSNSEVVNMKRSTAKAVKEGTATISGSYQGKALQVTVKVVPKLKKLAADVSTLTLKIGKTHKVAITALFDTGKTITVTDQIVWSSSNSTIATVSNGTIKALKKGTVTIKATYQKKTISVRVRIT